MAVQLKFPESMVVLVSVFSRVQVSMTLSLSKAQEV